MHIPEMDEEEEPVVLDLLQPGQREIHESVRGDVPCRLYASSRAGNGLVVEVEPLIESVDGLQEGRGDEARCLVAPVSEYLRECDMRMSQPVPAGDDSV